MEGAEIFRTLDMKPVPAHWVVKLLSSHNNYYPLKVLMEHAIGEGMVLDIFKDLLIQTLPDSDPRVPLIKKKLRLVCREEEEHIAWGEKETRRLLAYLGLPFEDACLRFHETRRYAPTPSYARVAEKVNDRSIGRWRHFAGELESHLATLAPALSAGGYAA